MILTKLNSPSDALFPTSPAPSQPRILTKTTPKPTTLPVPTPPFSSTLQPPPLPSPLARHRCLRCKRHLCNCRPHLRSPSHYLSFLLPALLLPPFDPSHSFRRTNVTAPHPTLQLDCAPRVYWCLAPHCPCRILRSLFKTRYSFRNISGKKNSKSSVNGYVEKLWAQLLQTVKLVKPVLQFTYQIFQLVLPPLRRGNPSSKASIITCLSCILLRARRLRVCGPEMS